MRRGLLCLTSLLLPCAVGFSQGLQPHTFVVESSSSLSFTGTASVPTPFGTVPVALTAGQPSYTPSGTQRINLNTSLSLGELPGTDALVIPTLTASGSLPLPGAPAVSLSVTGATLVLASPPFGINPSGGFTTGLAAATVASGDVNFNDPLTQTTYTTSIAGTTNSQPFNLSGTVTQVPGGYDASLVFTGLDLAVTQTTTNIVGSFTLTGSLTLSYRALNPDTGTISLSTGGAQTLHVSTGGPHGGDWYWVLASGSGTSPGIGVPGGFTLPLNYDPWFDFSVVAFNTTFLQNTQGILDGAGTATAQVVLPAGLSPALAGAQFHFAYATAANSPTAASVTSVSGPVSLTLVP